MFTNKLKANGEEKSTHKKKKYTLYNMCWGGGGIKNNWVHEYCIDCAFHTPNPEGGQGRGLCSVSSGEMAGGKMKTGDKPCNRHGEKSVCVCVGWGVVVGVVCWHTVEHSEKTRSSFQTPVQAKEWVSSVKESDTELSQVFFKYSTVRKSPHPLLSCLMLS